MKKFDTKQIITIIVTAVISLTAWLGNAVYNNVEKGITENKQSILSIAEIQIETVIKLAEITKDNESQQERLRNLERRIRREGIQE